MSVRQYIGARYVTKIYENSLVPGSAEWEAGVTYEPLTLVTYNNSSYLSKKEVPGSVGDPASNPNYWVVTGAYNGQIATLQQQITQILNYLDISNKKYVLIGDSYAQNYTTMGISVTGWIDQLITILSLTNDNVDPSHIFRESGKGFLGGDGDEAWLQFINGLAVDDTITDVIIVGGSNDVKYAEIGNDSALITAINDTLAAAATKFPKAKIHVGFSYMAYNVWGGTLTNRFKHCQDLYNYVPAMKGCSIIKNLNTALYDYSYMVNTSHPNSDGTMLLASIIASHIMGGNVTNGVARTSLTVDTTDANVTASLYQGGCTYSCTDNMCTIEFSGYQTNQYINVEFPPGTTLAPNGSAGLSIGFLDHLPINKKEQRILSSGVGYAKFGGSYVPMPFTLLYWQGYINIAPLHMDQNGWSTSDTFEQFLIPPFTITIDLTCGNVDG